MAKIPDPPEELAYLLLWYSEIRGANPRGWRFEPVSYSEIHAYKALHDLDLTGWDAHMLRRLDHIWMEVQPEPEESKPSSR